MQAAPTGGAVPWFQNDRGVRPFCWPGCDEGPASPGGPPTGPTWPLAAVGGPTPSWSGGRDGVGSRFYGVNTPSRLLWGEADRLAFESSAMATLDGWRSPVLMSHGDDHRNVPFLETVNAAWELRKRGVDHEGLVFPAEVHSFLLQRNVDPLVRGHRRLLPEDALGAVKGHRPPSVLRNPQLQHLVQEEEVGEEGPDVDRRIEVVHHLGAHRGE